MIWYFVTWILAIVLGWFLKELHLKIRSNRKTQMKKDPVDELLDEVEAYGEIKKVDIYNKDTPFVSEKHYQCTELILTNGIELRKGCLHDWIGNTWAIWPAIFVKGVSIALSGNQAMRLNKLCTKLHATAGLTQITDNLME